MSEQQPSLPGLPAPAFLPGQRVQAHPATDLWMMGARYGDVRRIDAAGIVWVKMDALTVLKGFRPDDLLPAGTP